MSPRRLWRSVALIGMLLLTWPTRVGATAYTFAPLDVPGSRTTVVFDINDAGQVVGAFSDATGGPHGFLLTRTTYTPLNVPGSRDTEAHGINNAGQIVGSFHDATGTHGFLLTGATYTPLDVPGNTFTDALGINDAGQVVGAFSDARGQHGFVFNGGQFTTLDVPGSLATVAFDINNAGQIVGLYQDATGIHGFIFNGGQFTTLEEATAVFGINDIGQIVGRLQGARGFLRTGGTLTPLDVPGSTFTDAYGINNVGQIVGNFSDARGTHGFLATPVLEPRALGAHTPGSFLVFPFFALDGDRNTTLCLTDVAEGPFGGTATWVRLNVVCKGMKGPNPFCDTFDAHFPVTYHGTQCIDLKNDPRYTPPCEQGFVVAFAETSTGVPQSHNFLIGHSQISAPNVLAEAPAVAVPSSAAPGTLLGGPNGDTLTFGPGGDYLALPTTLQGTFRASGPGGNTLLVVLTLDTTGGGQNPASRVAIDFWNANEVRYSAAHEFICWDAVPLSTIDSRFTQAGLGTAFGSVRITATGTCPIPGICPPLPVVTPTILGVLVDQGPGATLGVRHLFHTGSRATTYFPE